MKTKRILRGVGILALSILINGTLIPTTVLAAENSGGVDLDSIINALDVDSIEEPIVIYEEILVMNNPLARMAVTTGNGRFWVTKSLGHHYSNHSNPTYDHRATVGNKSTTLRSSWKSKTGGTATIGIKSTLTGNIAKWSTR